MKSLLFHTGIGLWAASLAATLASTVFRAPVPDTFTQALFLGGFAVLFLGFAAEEAGR